MCVAFIFHSYRHQRWSSTNILFLLFSNFSQENFTFFENLWSSFDKKKSYFQFNTLYAVYYVILKSRETQTISDKDKTYKSYSLSLELLNCVHILWKMSSLMSRAHVDLFYSYITLKIKSFIILLFMNMNVFVCFFVFSNS